MSWIKSHPWLLVFIALFLGANTYMLFQDNYYLLTLPLVLIILYMGIYAPYATFLLVVFFTPLSINLEAFTDGAVGLFIPTEPILFGLFVLVIVEQVRHPFMPLAFWKNPITISLGCYLVWLLMTSITSSLPLVSFKFLLMKLWYIIPLLLLGVGLFRHKMRIRQFFWLYAVSMSAVILFTLIRHAGYQFGEEEGHWVMSPFFKDHTIYGAAVAMNLFFIVGLLSSRKHQLLVHLVLLSLLVITLIGLYFSYTRGAWVSVAFAFVVWLCIHFRIRFRYLLVTGITLVALALFYWPQIEMKLSRNTQEHTTTEFDEKLQSAANITSDASNLERLNRWDAAFSMFMERPIVGFGPGTYAFEYAPYQDPDNLTIISTNFGDQGNAHSEFLGPLSETGFIGFLTIIFFVSALFYKGITLYIRLKNDSRDHREVRILLLAAVLAMSTYFFHGLLNNYLDTDKAAVPVYGVCAMIIAIELSVGSREHTA
ncbi:MAG: O-antigen ligase family protein [Bacteroidota bacterium]